MKVTQAEIEAVASICPLQYVTNPTRATIVDAFEEGARWALSRVDIKSPQTRLVELEGMITGLQERMRPLLAEWKSLNDEFKALDK